MQRLDRDGFGIDKRRRRGLAKALVLFAAGLFLVFGAGGAYADQVCSDCHDANPSGPCQHGVCDGGNCAACHGNPPVDAGGLIHLYADQPSPVASGSVSAGAHSTHATPSGQNYACGVCHYNGMSASSGQLIGGTNSGNGILQMGFSIPMPGGTTAGGGTYDGIAGLVYPYEATNGTMVTTGGAKTCSGIYCHSDGTSVSTGAALTAASPGWNTPGPLACTICHGYPPSYANGDTKANSHMAPGHNRPCNVCHSATTSDGTTITDPAKHANAVYDVLPADTSVDFSYAYDAAGGTCSVVACHGGVALQWGAAPAGTACTLCHTGHATGHMATDGSGHPVPDTCTSCHTQYASSAHAGTTRNLSNSCGSCHVTTGLSFISHSAIPMTAVPGQCTTCHLGRIATHAAHTGGTAHTLTTESTCTICHSATPRVRPTAGIMAACASCHGNKQVNHVEVDPVLVGPEECIDCHIVGGNADITSIIVNGCIGCHGWGNVASLWGDAVMMHDGGLPFAAFSASAGSGIDAWTVTLNTFGSDGSISSVNWGDGTDTLTTHTYASAGNKSITLNILKNGQTAGVTHSITLFDYPISGTVKSEGVGLDNVTIILTGTTSGTTVTDSNGAYSFSVRPGTYTVHAVKGGFTMSADVTSIVAAPGKTNANFTAVSSGAPFVVKRVSGAVDSYYLNLTDGLNAAVNGDIFYLMGIIFNESVIYDKTGVTVTLKGGYDDSSYILRSGTTLIGGSGRSMTIRGGTVIVDGIVIY